MPAAQTIQEVIDQLTKIIEQSGQEPSRMGYFATLYRKVTTAVKEKIDNHATHPYFDDPQRTEQLDVRFANRYLAAHDAYRAGQPLSVSWKYAFDVTQQWWPIVLQHLLLGMNAHINLDLGIAAARNSPGDELPSLKADFDRINGLLASLVNEVRAELARIWVPLRILNRYLGGEEDAIINFSMEVARRAAWSVAERLAPIPEAEQQPLIDELDEQTRHLAELIRHSGFFVGSINRIIRLGEPRSIPKIIRILSS